MAKRKKLTPTQKEKNRLARKIRSNVRELNRQIKIIKREQSRGMYALDYKTVEDTFEKMRQLTKTKSETRIGTGRLSHMSLEKLQEIEDTTSHALSLKSFKTKGRREMFNQAWNTTNERMFPNQKGLTKKQYANMIAMFSDDKVKEYMELKMLSSEQIVDMAAYVDGRGAIKVREALQETEKLFMKPDGSIDTAEMQRMSKAAPEAFRELVRANMETDPEERRLRLRELKSRYSL